MLTLSFDPQKDSPFHILCLGAHSDDIELGCGGTILRLIDTYPEVDVTWVVFSSNDVRAAEAQDAAKRFLQSAHRRDIIIKRFKDGFFPYIGGEVKTYFEELKRAIEPPDLVFTHYRHDLHQDHRTLSELTWNTFRDHCILEYEIPKYDGDLGHPNVFVPLAEELCERKITYLCESFASQRENHWFSREMFLAFLRLRGIESNSPSTYAEAFHGCRIIL